MSTLIREAVSGKLHLLHHDWTTQVPPPLMARCRNCGIEHTTATAATMLPTCHKAPIPTIKELRLLIEQQRRPLLEKLARLDALLGEL